MFDDQVLNKYKQKIISLLSQFDLIKTFSIDVFLTQRIYIAFSLSQLFNFYVV
ncbi:hypothetical protein NIES4102_15920 [Chondrocystis sp. NIES-4102]|nr:hypothetical protein NIES4102_15920 [Chondrocystis sp. NIES-4102]